MNQIYVSLDLETSGLDPEKDQIIEVGAIKFRGKEVIDTFDTLVNPRCSVPYNVRLLTGIAPEELETAPLFTDISAELLSFIGDHPIVGQNIPFDLSFLKFQGIRFSNTVYDILDIANIILPDLMSYNLAKLAAHLEIASPLSHRALADAMTAMDVFTALLEKASRLDLNLIAEINRLTISADWVWRIFLQDIERAHMGGRSLWDKEIDFSPSAVDCDPGEPLVSGTIIKPLDLKRLTILLGEDGLMAKTFPGFEYRKEQVSMMQAVAEAMNKSENLIVEAGTGIGKSVAYLLPAIKFALENNTHVVVSTNTVSRQEQLVKKDIPDLLHVLGMAREDNSELKVTQLEVRTNYLCLRRWNYWYKTPGLPWEEVRFLLRLIVWLSSTSSGDRTGLNFSGNEFYLWSRVNASKDNCVTERCPYYLDRCFLYRARRRAEGAHIIVVNHALLLSDSAEGGSILPEYNYLVIDEAHHLEEEATGQFGYGIKEGDIYDYLDHFNERSDFLFHLRSYLRNSSISSSKRSVVEQSIQALQDQTGIARESASRHFHGITNFLFCQFGGRSEYERSARLTRELRSDPRWREFEKTWQNTELQLSKIDGILGELSNILEALPDRGGLELNSSIAEILSLRQSMESLRHRMGSIMVPPEEQNVHWLSLKGQNDALSLHSAPLRAGVVLEKLLFSSKKCVVLTGAALSTGGNFDYIRDSLGLIGVKELMISGSFGNMSSTMIYLPQDIPELDKPGYQSTVEQTLIDLCWKTQGRTLVLFTSHSAIRNTCKAIREPLEQDGILVLGQGIDGGHKRILDTFKTNKSVLLGTTSLLEGVGIAGEAFSVLIIARLPFNVPSDPVFAARSELFRDPFNQYNIPLVALKLKQGFERLIRSRKGRGVMIVLDRRVQTKSYGKVILQSLPGCTVKTGSLKQMPQEVTDWIGD